MSEKNPRCSLTEHRGTRQVSETVTTAKKASEGRTGTGWGSSQNHTVWKKRVRGVRKRNVGGARKRSQAGAKKKKKARNGPSEGRVKLMKKVSHRERRGKRGH